MSQFRSVVLTLVWLMLGGLTSLFGQSAAPVITVQPVSQTVVPGSHYTFSVGPSDDPTFSFQWLFNGAPITGSTIGEATVSGANTWKLAVDNIQADTQGTFSVAVSNQYGTTLSRAATLTVLSAPIFTSNLTSQTVLTGQTLRLGISVQEATGTSLQWYKDGVAILGATGAGYGVLFTKATDAGVYTVEATDANGVVVTSAPADVTVETDARLTNLSTLATVDNSGLTEGFIIGGTGSKNVLIRGVGPALTNFDYVGVLTNPMLTLNASSGSPAMTNAGWVNSSAMTNAFAAVGAFAFPAGSADTAILATLQGSQTATVVGANGATGYAMVEVYDCDALTSPARLVNLSVAGYITPQHNLLGGFVIQGTSWLTLLVRAVGPGLAPFGGTDLLAQPRLNILEGQGYVYEGTDTGNWALSLAPVFTEVGAFGLTAGTADRALLLALPPGVYTAVLSTGDSGSGNALLEIYEIR